MRILLIWALLVLSGAASAQGKKIGDRAIQFCISEMENVTVRRDLVYKPEAKGSPERAFDLYLPADTPEDRRLPVVLFINGIGLPGQKNFKVYSSWARAAAAHGMAAITFDVDQESVEADIDLLVSHLKFNVDALPVDGNNMCWWACGRNVDRSLPMALEEDRAYLKCVVVYYGMPLYTPKLRADLPLMLVKAGRGDRDLNRRIDHFASSAASANRDITYVVYPDGDAAFDVFDSSTRSRAIIKDTLEFMSLHLSPSYQIECEVSTLTRQGYAAYEEGQWAECAQYYRRALTLDPEQGHAHFMVGLAELLLGDYEEAVRRFETSIELDFRRAASTYNIACAHAKAGDKDEAFKYLHKAREVGFNDLALLKADSDLDNLRGDPRFAELLRSWGAQH